MKQDDVVEVVRKDSLRIAKERLQKARDDITQSIQDIIDLQTDTLSAQHSGLADELEALLAEIGTLPLSEEWMYSAIHHCQRNMNFECDDEGEAPDQYAGMFIARLVNRLPTILPALRSSRAAQPEIKTWEQRCEEQHLDHEIVTDDMIQSRMKEEIADLRGALRSQWRRS